jgi:uncharacterized protein (DUF1330 family)
VVAGVEDFADAATCALGDFVGALGGTDADVLSGDACALANVAGGGDGVEGDEIAGEDEAYSDWSHPRMRTDWREGDMKKGYWVVAYHTVGDEATMKSYVELAVAALVKFGARTLVPPGNAVTAREAGLQQMTVVVSLTATRMLWLLMTARIIRRLWLRLGRA